MAEFLYRIQPSRVEMLRSGPTEVESRQVSAHFAYLQGLTKDGIVLLAGRTLTDDEASFGMVIFRAESEDEARKIMTADPAVENGVMRAELFPFSVALMAAGNQHPE